MTIGRPVRRIRSRVEHAAGQQQRDQTGFAVCVHKERPCHLLRPAFSPWLPEPHMNTDLGDASAGTALFGNEALLVRTNDDATELG
jgi:hypothetical protein